jgi:hypothetical protein
MQITFKLSDTGGINLMLFCMRSGSIADHMQRSHLLFHDFIFHKKVPTPLVVNHLEHEETLQDWWPGNHSRLTEHDIRVVGHVCITARGDFGDRYHASRKLVHNLLIPHGY